MPFYFANASADWRIAVMAVAVGTAVLGVFVHIVYRKYMRPAKKRHTEQERQLKIVETVAAEVDAECRTPQEAAQLLAANRLYDATSEPEFAAELAAPFFPKPTSADSAGPNTKLTSATEPTSATETTSEPKPTSPTAATTDAKPTSPTTPTKKTPATKAAAASKAGGEAEVAIVKTDEPDKVRC
mmetsp:Transcript_28195/g.86407  ORF Transcript_28195/g.86407 Transcript_28195/m.86407 type:complete len:185 (+) Transcript_28195:486-1040(+)